MDDEELGFGFEDRGEALESCLREDVFAEGGGGESRRGEKDYFEGFDIEVSKHGLIDSVIETYQCLD